ncbi:MAG TPA: putative lipopolysaccharide heptosyltransferase III [Casimicrobiaceae bacterium]
MFNPLPDAVDTAAVRRVLVTKLRHHGDVLLASPVFTVLKRALPSAEIDALVYRETAPMLEGHPAITRIHTVDREWKREGLIAQASAEWRLLSKLRARDIDLLVHLTEHPRGAWLARALKPRYAVGRERKDAGRLWRKSFTHQYRLPRATPRHTVECNLDALRRIGLQPADEDKRLVLSPDDKSAARVRNLLAQQGLEPHRFLQVHPGSRWLFKCWPPEHSAALLDRLTADGLRVAVTGAPDARERTLVEAILAACASASRSRIVDLVGTMTLRELAAFTREARAFVGVDSAPMHIAAAVGTPVVALFGPSGEVEWGPWRVEHRIVASTSHPCRPCGIDGCGGGKVSECLSTLPVDRVHAALAQMLSVAPARSA